MIPGVDIVKIVSRRGWDGDDLGPARNDEPVVVVDYPRFVGYVLVPADFMSSHPELSFVALAWRQGEASQGAVKEFDTAERIVYDVDDYTAVVIFGNELYGGLFVDYVPASTQGHCNKYQNAREYGLLCFFHFSLLGEWVAQLQ